MAHMLEAEIDLACDEDVEQDTQSEIGSDAPSTGCVNAHRNTSYGLGFDTQTLDDGVLQRMGVTARSDAGSPLDEPLGDFEFAGGGLLDLNVQELVVLNAQRETGELQETLMLMRAREESCWPEDYRTYSARIVQTLREPHYARAQQTASHEPFPHPYASADQHLPTFSSPRTPDFSKRHDVTDISTRTPPARPPQQATHASPSHCRAAYIAWFLKTQRDLGLSLTSVSLAVNYLDRLLASSCSRLTEAPFMSLPHFMELLPIVCLSLGCKMDETYDFKPEDLQAFSQEDGCRVHDSLCVNEMEQLLVQELNWELSSVVPVAYVSHLLCPLYPCPSPLSSSYQSPSESPPRYSNAPSHPSVRAMQIKWARTLAVLWSCVNSILFYCLTEPKALDFTAAEIACGAVLCALETEELCPPNALKMLSNSLKIPVEMLLRCRHVLGEAVDSAVAAHMRAVRVRDETIAQWAAVSLPRQGYKIEHNLERDQLGEADEIGLQKFDVAHSSGTYAGIGKKREREETDADSETDRACPVSNRDMALPSMSHKAKKSHKS